jgi:hypothetical protein
LLQSEQSYDLFWLFAPISCYSDDPEQSLHFLLGGILPVEEVLFFLLTNTLLTFGMTLLLSAESHERVNDIHVIYYWGRTTQD